MSRNTMSGNSVNAKLHFQLAGLQRALRVADPERLKRLAASLGYTGNRPDLYIKAATERYYNKLAQRQRNRVPANLVSAFGM